VDNHILKLRQKLERDPANPVHFRTVHGVGYKFVS
jgi:DNA-binding response OmpR family regulator